MNDSSNEADRRELLKSASRKIDALRASLAEAESRHSDPVAIVGMGCRLPGGVDDADSFWRLLSQGMDGTTEIPPDRWHVDDYYDPDPDVLNKMYSRRGGFINNVRSFDPLFFHVSPLQAASMDPQQRLLLEVAWEAIEHAGQAPDQLAGSRTGVFVGMPAGDYALMAVRAMQRISARAHTATGLSASVAAGYISYFLGLHGPAMAIDTACSSALTAIHLAVQSLRKGESTAALAGAVNVILAPEGNIIACQAGMLSPDGHCKTFDASADGYVRGEGCGVLMLKLLSRAQADGNRILAVIRGSACNQDGRTNGITAPNGHAQREVIQAAIADARLSPNDIDYVESHGTGTSLGDPVEVQALGEVFLPGRPANRKVVLGAVKSNIGHLEAAAGVAAIGKVILALQKGQIPANLHFNTPNPLIPWNTLPFSIPTELTPWIAAGPTRIASVSAFGFSGTNVHMVLEQAPEPPFVASVQDRDSHLLILSARTPTALSELAHRYIGFLAEAPSADLADICFTASIGRTHFAHRLALVGRDTREMETQLASYTGATNGSEPVLAGQAPTQPPRMALLIGEVPPSRLHQHLLLVSHSFRSAFNAVQLQATRLLSVPALSDALTQQLESAVPHGRETLPHRVLSFALAHAMTAQWLDWGLAPSALAASGQQAYVAAATVGALTLADALLLAIAPHAVDAAGIIWSAPTLPIIDVATGSPLSAALLGRLPDHERLGATQSAPLVGTLDFMRRDGIDLLLRIGAGAQSETAPASGERDRSQAVIIQAGCDDWADILRAAGALYVAGAPPNWQKFEAHWPRRRLALPTYPFQRQQCWLDVVEPTLLEPSRRAPRHPVLGRRIHGHHFGNDIVFESELSATAPAFLNDHRYFSTVVVAMATLLDMVIVAWRTARGGEATVEGVTIEQPLLLPPGQTRLVQTILKPGQDDGFAFAIMSADLDDLETPSPWRRHCTGVVRAMNTAPLNENVAAINELSARYTDEAEPNWFYETVAKSGLEYGPAFRLMRKIWRGDDGVLAELALPRELAESARDHAIHPGLLDSAIQALGLCRAIARQQGNVNDAYLPVGVERCFASTHGITDIWCHATLRPVAAGDLDTLTGDIALLAPTGELIGEIAGIQFRRNATRQLGQQFDERRLANWLYESRWEASPAFAKGVALTGKWLIVADEDAAASAFASRIRQDGGVGILAQPGDGFAINGTDRYVIRLDSGADYDQLLQALGAAGPVDFVIFFAGTGPRPEGQVADLPALARRQTGNVLHLVQALSRSKISAPKKLVLVTQGFAAASLGAPMTIAAGATWGIGRVIAAELPDLNCKLCDLDPALSPSQAAEVLAMELADPSSEVQVALGKSYRRRLRLHRASTNTAARLPVNAIEASGPVQLEIGAGGDFQQLHLAPQEIEAPGPGDVQLRILATALNFRDVLNVLGMYPGDAGALGVECVGEIVAIGTGVQGFALGDRVVAIPRRGYCTFANAPASMVFRVPATLPPTQAATLLVAYLTASYSLDHLGRMTAGNRVLIHAAAGGVGLAAVQLAQRAGAEIFATAGSPAKREYLRQIGVPHIMDSRSVEFASQIRAQIGERGLDLVLNSLTGQAMTESLDLLRPGGSFLEIGKTGNFTPQEAHAINPFANHLVVDLLGPFQETPGLMHGLFNDILDSLATGAIQPLPHRGFPLQEAGHAFRYMASAKHIGKVVVLDRAVGASVAIDPMGCYLITGGLGGLGLTIAQALAREGARNILLIGRRPPTADAQAKIAAIEDLGATVRVGCADVADRAQLASALTDHLTPANPLRGVIHAAGLIDDGSLLLQTEARLDQVMAPKIDGAWHLHELTLGMSLDFFIMFSSGAGVFGNPGQSGYAAASVFLDTLANARHAAGLPALSIDWGPWAEVGMAARMDEARTKGWASRGVYAMTPDEGTRVLRMLLDMEHSGQIAVLPVEPAAGQRTAPGRTINPFPGNVGDAPAPVPVARSGHVARRLQDAPAQEKLGVVISVVSEMVLDIFGLDPAHVLDADQNFTDLGMDSLLAIQLSNRLKIMFAINVPATLAFQRPTVREVSEYVLEVMSLTAGADPQSPDEMQKTALVAAEIADPRGASSMLTNLGQLSDREVEQLLSAAELGNSSA
jgi:acyl transferase domain-containing protein/acyl carrier protein